MDGISLTFTTDPQWQVAGGVLLAGAVLWFLCSHWRRWKSSRPFRKFEKRARKKWEGHRLK